MTDLHLIALLKKHGWKLHTRNTLRNWTKERLIDEIECLENNWSVSLEREEISFEYKKKLIAENERLEQLNNKMQCCENCKHKQCGMKEIFKEVKQKDKTKTCDEWELADENN